MFDLFFFKKGESDAAFSLKFSGLNFIPVSLFSRLNCEYRELFKQKAEKIKSRYFTIPVFTIFL